MWKFALLSTKEPTRLLNTGTPNMEMTVGTPPCQLMHYGPYNYTLLTTDNHIVTAEFRE